MSLTIVPSSGPVTGGNTVTITGYQNGFNIAFLTIGGRNVTNQIYTETQLTATVPAGDVGDSEVLLRLFDTSTEPPREATLTGTYTYLAGVPIALDPTQGLTSGGFPVTITGVGVGTATGVTFGGVPATNLVVNDANSITVTAPANVAGFAQVIVTYPVLPESSAFFEYIVPCVAPRTKVLMATGHYKEIQDIVRGEFVAGDAQCKTRYQVSRVNVLPFTAGDECQVVEFSAGSLGANSPFESLCVTGFHPVIYKGRRREASCFRNMPGVICSHQRLLDAMGTARNGTMNVYDLQFDVDAQYVANGVVIQSRSPHYVHTPLPKALHFRQSLYSTYRTHGTRNHPVPADNTIL